MDLLKRRYLIFFISLFFVLIGCAQPRYAPLVSPKSSPTEKTNAVLVTKEASIAVEAEKPAKTALPPTPVPEEEGPKIDPSLIADANIELAEADQLGSKEPPDEESPVASPKTDSPPQPAVANDIANTTPPDNTSNIPDTPEKDAQTLVDEALDYYQVSQELWQKGELENALEALDQAYYLILQIETNADPKWIQQREDLRFMISRRILEIYASRNIVVNGEHKAIPMDINRHVQREIDLFTKGAEKKFFANSYRRSGRYRQPMIEALKKAGLPVELSWLPLIESGFIVNALSKARALGLWQFIPSTGYKFGLKRNFHIDERLDPEKATRAAVAYLSELHRIFGDWTTVLAAYNCGEGRVLRVIRQQNVNYLDNFWDLYQRLPRETARYVPRYLATLHIVNDLEKYGLDGIQVDPPLESETVSIKKQIRLKDIAKTIGVSQTTLKTLNPELRHNLLPPTKYDLRVPPGVAKTLRAKLDQIKISAPPRRAFTLHRIRSGETLSTIARRYHVSMGSIMRANRITKKHLIIAGKKLKIPQKGGQITQSTPTGKKLKKRSPYPRQTRHVVKSGDSLWIIARRYGTTVKEIQELNRITGTKLSIGQSLKISRHSEDVKTDKQLKTYHVKRGDSPYKIAMRFNINLERFLKLNRLTPRSKIFPGQKVYVE